MRFANCVGELMEQPTCKRFVRSLSFVKECFMSASEPVSAARRQTVRMVVPHDFYFHPSVNYEAMVRDMFGLDDSAFVVFEYAEPVPEALRDAAPSPAPRASSGTTCDICHKDIPDAKVGKNCPHCGAVELSQFMPRYQPPASSGAPADAFCEVCSHIITHHTTGGCSECPCSEFVRQRTPREAALLFSVGNISAGKLGELLGLQPGELHDFKTACHAFCDAPPASSGAPAEWDEWYEAQEEARILGGPTPERPKAETPSETPRFTVEQVTQEITRLQSVGVAYERPAIQMLIEFRQHLVSRGESRPAQAQEER